MRIPRAVEQPRRALQFLSPEAATTDTRGPRACAPQQEKQPQGGAHTSPESSPRSLQLEKNLAATKTQHSHKGIKEVLIT